MELLNDILRVLVTQKKIEITVKELCHTLNCTEEALQKQLSTQKLLKLCLNKGGIYTIKFQPENLCLCEGFLNGDCYNKSCPHLHVCRFGQNCKSLKPSQSEDSERFICKFPHKLSDRVNNTFILKDNKCLEIDQVALLDLLRLHREYDSKRVNLGEKSSSLVNIDKQSLNNYPLHPKTTGKTNGLQIKDSKTSTMSSLRETSEENIRRQNDTICKSSDTTTLPKIPDGQTSTNSNKTRQIDVIIPSEKFAPNMDFEMVELILDNKCKGNGSVKQIVNETADENYRRYTIEFDNRQSVDQLLTHPVITYANVELKIKRTLRQIDKQSFTLKILTDTKLDPSRVELYVEALVGKPTIVTDMTNSSNNENFNEQILLIKCEQQIDFEKVHKVYSLKNKLQNKVIRIGEVYEADTIEVGFVNEQQITLDLLKLVFGSLWSDVFCFTITNNGINVDIELINFDCLNKWLLESHKFEKEFELFMRPIIDLVDEQCDKTDDQKQESQQQQQQLSPLLSQSQRKQSEKNYNNDEKSEQEKQERKTGKEVNIYLKQEWAVVAAHPVFQTELIQYIKAQLNCDIEVHDNIVTTNNLHFYSNTRFQTPESILVNRINNFMQYFQSRECKLKNSELNILKEHSQVLSYKKMKDNIYFVIGRNNLINKLFPTQNRLSSIQQSTSVDSLSSIKIKETNEQRSSIQEQTDSQQSPFIDKDKPLHSMEKIHYPIENSSHLQFFSLQKFEERLKYYLQCTFKVNMTVIRDTKIVLEITGRNNDICSARDAIGNLFLSLQIKIFDDKTAGNWTIKIPDSIYVIQEYLNKNDIICICQHSTKKGITVSYFSNSPQFGLDPTQIDDILNIFLSLSSQISSSSTKLLKKWQEYEKIIHDRPDYNKNICFASEPHAIHLFGLPDIVKEVHSTFENLKKDLEPKLCKTTLNPNQINYLLKVCHDKLKVLEKQHSDDSVEITSKLQNSEFKAPIDLHEKIKLFLLENSQIDITRFDIKCPQSLSQTQKQRFDDVAQKFHCLLEMKIEQTQTQSQHTNSSSTLSSTTTTTNVNIHQGTIHVRSGDLTTQSVDAVVVCSTSDVLRKAIIDVAGRQVNDEFTNQSSVSSKIIETSSGSLPCKRILFIPWTPHQKDQNMLQKSIRTFVSDAVVHALNIGCTSIAFPAIGCGKFGVPADFIADIMIDEAENLLMKYPSKFSISFVLLPQQRPVYNEFCKQLNALRTKRTNPAHQQHPMDSSPQNVLKITLISSASNTNNVKKCRQELQQLIQ
ncbi:unnamed protein product [Didymodactylos carnosus]|uniref:Macro domain-containing protein n=1 Tax=Didymodactylos carnosus TaxID=1234261 RepID=A0A814FZL6_9BILA|nr:unnamed protein product [Didymodactylos carnosus]CAF0987017.1 unnamed protein product [Didymodactylos carnosus]CAF3626031.1 unnamed protein product [Didymodactylos carnosus]CAF3759217.1 unnamed protein product [Didymodactylos carnosus]